MPSRATFGASFIRGRPAALSILSTGAAVGAAESAVVPAGADEGGAAATFGSTASSAIPTLRGISPGTLEIEFEFDAVVDTFADEPSTRAGALCSDSGSWTC